MFSFFKNEKPNHEQPIISLVVVTPERGMATARDQGLIGYMADMPFNEANPHTVEDGMCVGVELPTSVTHVLHHPDPHKKIGLNADGTEKKKRSQKEKNLTDVCTINGDIKLLDWLKQKLSKKAWENDSGYRDILPRAVIAIFLEGDPQKVQLANEFLCAISPYSTRNVKSQTLTETTTGVHVEEVEDIATDEMQNDIVSNFVQSLQNIPGFQAIKEIYRAVTVGFDAEHDDFTICMWTRLLYLCDRENLGMLPETRAHLLQNLLKFDGVHYDGAIPNTLGFKPFAAMAGYPITDKGIQNSENHLLMINGSAYLKNQIVNPGINAGSELEHELCKHLDELYETGLSEFNAIPYAGYTINALLNLHDFATEPVKNRATRVLDKIFYDYVIHTTHDGKSFRPFARQSKKVTNQDFMVDDSVRPFMMTWLGANPGYYRQKGTTRNAMFAFNAVTTSYRPPLAVYNLEQTKTGGYLALTGQRFGNAEVSYKNWYTPVNASSTAVPRQYMLSGGGVVDYQSDAKKIEDYAVNQSTVSKMLNVCAWSDAKTRIQRTAGEVVSRNLTLIIDSADGPCTLADAFYLGTDSAITNPGNKLPWGPGVDSKGKNNSGIYFDTMVGAYPVHIPNKFKGQGIKPTSNIDNTLAQQWTLYTIDSGLRVAVFDGKVLVPNQTTQEQIGIVLVIPGACANPQELINAIADENKTASILSEVKFPDNCGSVMHGKKAHYNPLAALDRWVIGGFPGCDWGKSRFFSNAPMRKNTHEYSPGWSAHSVIQRSPNEAPQNLLAPQDPTPYDFLNLTPVVALQANSGLTSNR